MVPHIHAFALNIDYLVYAFGSLHTHKVIIFIEKRQNKRAFTTHTRTYARIRFLSRNWDKKIIISKVGILKKKRDSREERKFCITNTQKNSNVSVFFLVLCKNPASTWGFIFCLVTFDFERTFFFGYVTHTHTCLPAHKKLISQLFITHIPHLPILVLLLCERGERRFKIKKYEIKSKWSWTSLQSKSIFFYPFFFFNTTKKTLYLNNFCKVRYTYICAPYFHTCGGDFYKLHTKVSSRENEP